MSKCCRIEQIEQKCVSLFLYKSLLSCERWFQLLFVVEEVMFFFSQAWMNTCPLLNSVTLLKISIIMWALMYTTFEEVFFFLIIKHKPTSHSAAMVANWFSINIEKRIFKLSWNLCRSSQCFCVRCRDSQSKMYSNGDIKAKRCSQMEKTVLISQ